MERARKHKYKDGGLICLAKIGTHCGTVAIIRNAKVLPAINTYVRVIEKRLWDAQIVVGENMWKSAWVEKIECGRVFLALC